MIIFIAAGFLYPILYNYVYKNGILEDSPVAVVDNADCSDSRRMIREMDATREIDIAYECVSMEEAKELLRTRRVNGIIYFPGDFGEKLAHRETATFSIYADMSSFLYYKNVLMGSNFVMLHEVNNIKLERFRADGLTDAQADQSVNTVLYDDINPYNRAFSYSIFLISAILMLIVQQVMFYGMSMSVGTMREENRSFATLPDHLKGRGVGRVVLGRGAVYWLIFMIIGIYVTCIVPAMFHFPQRGSFQDILILLALVVTVCVFFCMSWSTLVTRRESAFILFLFMSPVCVFLTGFSWPTTAFPAFWKYFSYLFPSTFGCQAFINLNTAGANLEIVAPQLRALCIQGAVYFVLACISVYVENFVIRHRDEIKERLGR
jgi:ABC-2 type transport system permease protein